jgi:hypothetical protein
MLGAQANQVVELGWAVVRVVDVDVVAFEAAAFAQCSAQQTLSRAIKAASMHLAMSRVDLVTVLMSKPSLMT